MNNKDILQIAMAQSAEDIGCKVEDFTKTENVICTYNKGEKARLYIKPGVIGNFVSYGSNVVASVQDDIRDITEEYLKRFEFYHLFESPNMNWLSEKLSPLGYGVCFMAEYYLPDKDNFYDKGIVRPLVSEYELRVLEQKDFAELYLPEWGNALCEERKELDVLGAGAYKDGKLVGLAGCSADCDDMWQIGVDVLPECRRGGIASALTSRLASEIFARGKVPFYCSAWSNIRSVRNAVKCGFIPAWVEMTIKPLSFINELNEEEKDQV
ncbi:MAG: GNAT family N-acetyltransferase [Eubacterium sp.]|nr:GNAT family N-acetyltransferase [Eubacterium sp.]